MRAFFRTVKAASGDPVLFRAAFTAAELRKACGHTQRANAGYDEPSCASSALQSTRGCAPRRCAAAQA